MTPIHYVLIGAALSAALLPAIAWIVFCASDEGSHEAMARGYVFTSIAALLINAAALLSLLFMVPT